jgi:integrase
MASVFKPDGSKKYIIMYVDESGRRRKKTGTTDKGVTQRIANDLENNVALRIQGLIDPAAERFADSARKPIDQHVDDFVASMEARARDAKHIRTTRTYVERILAQAKAEHVSDLSPATVTLALGAIGHELGLSARAVNAHSTAVKAFMRWAWKDGRIRAYELGNIGRRNELADRRYVRRPMSDTELRTLIATARIAPEWRGISGNDRSWFYVLGAVTGFRRSEIGELRPEDFDLERPMPVVCLDGSRTKNGKNCEQPLPRSLAVELQPWLASKTPGIPVLELPEKTALMLHADLRLCGIEPVDAQGRVVDTHSLRHGYGTALARAGVPIKVAQTLLRHSDPKLTMNVYAHLTAFDLHGAIADALPDLTTEAPSGRMIMTGTDPSPVSIPDATQYTTQENVDGPNSRIGKAVTPNGQLTLNQRVVGSERLGASFHRHRSREVAVVTLAPIAQASRSKPLSANAIHQHLPRASLFADYSGVTP